MDQILQIFEWKRLLLGDEPPWFFIEILFRTAVVYVYALLLIRWLGSRTIGQLSTIEFLLVIALGSAVGDSMFYPDVPLLHALLVITVVVVANKGLDVLIAKNSSAERALDGAPEEAVRDGVICQSFLSSTSLSQSELFQQLREKGISQLGEVAHAYIETDGMLSVFKATPPHPGLPIVPPWENTPPPEITSGDRDFAVGQVACKTCGAIAQEENARCLHCDDDHWIKISSSGLAEFNAGSSRLLKKSAANADEA